MSSTSDDENFSNDSMNENDNENNILLTIADLNTMYDTNYRYINSCIDRPPVGSFVNELRTNYNFDIKINSLIQNELDRRVDPSIPKVVLDLDFHPVGGANNKYYAKYLKYKKKYLQLLKK
jgi:hypothetical protein